VTAIDGANNASAATSALNITTDRELLFQDSFSRPDQEGPGTPWSYSGFSDTFNTVNFQASGDSPGDYSSRWRNASLSSYPSSFKATVTVTKATSYTYGTGLLLYSRLDSQTGLRVGYRVVLTGASLNLNSYTNLNNAGQTGTNLATYAAGTYIGTISVETNSSTGSVKVYLNGVLRIDTTIPTANMTGDVGITGWAQNAYGNVLVSLDNFMLERN
jgi:hypothetical protein